MAIVPFFRFFSFSKLALGDCLIMEMMMMTMILNLKSCRSFTHTRKHIDTHTHTRTSADIIALIDSMEDRERI